MIFLPKCDIALCGNVRNLPECGTCYRNPELRQACKRQEWCEPEFQGTVRYDMDKPKGHRVIHGEQCLTYMRWEDKE
jgi:hypothetical protein